MQMGLHIKPRSRRDLSLDAASLLALSRHLEQEMATIDAALLHQEVPALVDASSICPSSMMVLLMIMDLPAAFSVSALHAFSSSAVGPRVGPFLHLRKQRTRASVLTRGPGRRPGV